MKFDKKAMVSASFLVGAIIVIASFMVIAPLAVKMVGEDETKIERLCRDTVSFRTAAALNLGSLKEIKGAPILCKTIDKKISGSEEEIKKKLADMMARCWWMFNEGRTQGLFEDIPGLGGRNKGFVCYTAIVEESDEFEKGEVINDFNDYLAKAKYPKLKDATYLDYIQYKGGGPGRIILALSDGVIKPNHAFKIVFVEKRGDTNSWIGGLAAGVGAAALVTGAIVLAIPSFGTSLIAVGGVVVGTAAVGIGAQIEFEKLFQENDVGLIMIVDMSNKKVINELDRNVIEDIAGE